MYVRRKPYILYFFSILVGVLCLVGSLVFGALSIGTMFYFSYKNISNISIGRFSISTGVISFILVVFTGLCVILNRVFFVIRTNAREKLEFDEFGQKKGNEYKNLSAKEKREIDRQRLIDAERLLSASELKSVIHKGSSNPETDLNELIGLSEAKKEVKNLEALLAYNQKYGNKKQTDPIHFCFLGSPGTGKTTVARIMTGILYKYKYIKKNQCVEIDASFLKGTTPDETLKKTKIILQKSKNGVLFIDEAYSLLSGVNGDEIVAEMVKYMEDHKNEFVLILAGYQEDMKRLINSNPGLYSRIRKYIWFRDFDITELKEIFRLAANREGYYVENDAYDQLEIRIGKEKSGQNFGNARTILNIFQSAKEKHAYNVMNGYLGKEKIKAICAEDIETETDAQKIFG